jgi:aminoglycoside phosphotransferase (APT) family kinase protein
MNKRGKIAMTPLERTELGAILHKLDPHATLLSAWELQGGISAQMTAFETITARGQRRKLIVRRPGEWALQHNPNAAAPNAAANEFRILQIVHSAGVKCQTPYLLDTSGEILPSPYLVIEYIEGEADYAPVDITRCVVQMAEQLATLHSLERTQVDLDFLPMQAPRLTKTLAERPAALDHSLDEGRIRDALEAAWSLPQPEPPALLHGDFWPGNLLWREGKLVAVIDWEDAEVGNPLADLATTRLDLLWIFGPDGMRTFTRHYQQRTGFDFATLPYWDLFAALRPASRLHVWAAGWPELGRSDITEATMSAGHHYFVEQAFAQLGKT